MRTILCILFLLSSLAATSMAQTLTNQYYELAQYQGIALERISVMDEYLERALLPALERLGIENVGVFRVAGDDAKETSFYLLVPLKDAQQVATYKSQLHQDADYQGAAAPYLMTESKSPVFQRIRSELLIAFDCMPQLKVPEQKTASRDRLFELRTYESSTERLGNLKVEMFNSGEVPIFLDSGIQPVFFGQCLVGDRMPSLTYMTVYDDAASRDAAWKKFIEHPDWKVLSGVEKYRGTVSKIYKTDLIPRPYSRL